MRSTLYFQPPELCAFDCHQLQFLASAAVLTLSRNYQPVRESSWFNVLSVSDSFLIKSFGRKLPCAAARRPLYGAISSDAFG